MHQNLPSVIQAKYLNRFTIELTFDDGIKEAVDFTQWLDGEVFEPLKKPSYFKKFFLDGSTVAWPNGADIAPETLYLAATSGHNKRVERTAKRGPSR